LCEVIFFSKFLLNYYAVCGIINVCKLNVKGIFWHFPGQPIYWGIFFRKEQTIIMISEVKNLAVLVAGIDEEYQNGVLEGIIAYAKEHKTDVSVFSAFGGVISNSRYDVGEYNIYNLVNYEKFDGIILMHNTIGDPDQKAKIITKAMDSGLPVAVLDNADHPEFYNISIDNSTSMREIVRHVIREHGAKVINYVSGPLANPEALARYEAFLEVMAENGLAVDARRVYFGEFRPADGKKAADQFLSSGLPLPDAIISANDAMALTVIAELERAGYRVPDDIIVTGFDSTYNARHHCPALTTVSRPLSEAGYKACETIMQLINGESPEKTVVLESKPVFTESCGCRSIFADDMKLYKKSAYKLIDNCRTDISLLNRMTSELADTETAEENIEVISRYIRELECERCCICLCSEWNAALNDKWRGRTADEYQIHGYTKTMSAPLIWDKGEVRSCSSFPSADMQPEPLTEGGNISYFLPLHFRERCLGYYIITNGNFPIKSLLCHSLMMNISNSIENIRKLLNLNSVIQELDRLYVIDPLCGIFNRNGFIREADILFRQCKESKVPLLISFIDMDGLKIINDSYGHKEGDFALQRLASVISECCKNGRICARFGGDEFIIVGADAEEEDAEALERSFKSRLENLNRMIGKPYEVAASIGTIVTEIESDKTLFNLITQADEIMYEKKKRKKTSRYLRKA